MTERLIDAVCPHCGRVGTTVRVVLQEDGHTKLSRRCTDCGGECIHTFDHDWLAAANNKKLRSENERLTSDVALVAERVRQLSEERDYAWAEVEKQRADNERLRADRRERIATAALQGMLSNPHNSQWEPQDYFRAAVYYADGLIAELDKEEGKP